MKNRMNFLDQMLLSTGLPFAAILFVITMIGLFTEKKIIVGAGILCTTVAFGITIVRSKNIAKQMSQLTDIMSGLALGEVAGELAALEKKSIELNQNEEGKQLLKACMMIAENQKNHLMAKITLENDLKKEMEKQTMVFNNSIDKSNVYETALDAIGPMSRFSTN
jgi:NADH:ubiquinone oxidoreductase subunit K